MYLRLGPMKSKGVQLFKSSRTTAIVLLTAWHGWARWYIRTGCYSPLAHRLRSSPGTRSTSTCSTTAPCHSAITSGLVPSNIKAHLLRHREKINEDLLPHERGADNILREGRPTLSREPDWNVQAARRHRDLGQSHYFHPGCTCARAVRHEKRDF